MSMTQQQSGQLSLGSACMHAGGGFGRWLLHLGTSLTGIVQRIQVTRQLMAALQGCTCSCLSVG